MLEGVNSKLDVLLLGLYCMRSSWLPDIDISLRSELSIIFTSKLIFTC